jgi:hypothetical protein
MYFGHVTESQPRGYAAELLSLSFQFLVCMLHALQMGGQRQYVWTRRDILQQSRRRRPDLTRVHLDDF